MALEAARRGLARSVVAISPIGLWKEHPAVHVKYVFGGLRFMVRTFPALVKAAMRVPLLRELMLAVPMSVGSRRMPAIDAVRVVDDLAATAAFEETFAHTRAPFHGAGIAVPVTVAFGERDWILTRDSRRRDQLPPHTHWVHAAGLGPRPDVGRSHRRLAPHSRWHTIGYLGRKNRKPQTANEIELEPRCSSASSADKPHAG